ncbi:MAG: hypothetical protein V1717_04535 [Candidatus Micrarchaeota archaeon]
MVLEDWIYKRNRAKLAWAAVALLASVLLENYGFNSAFYNNVSYSDVLVGLSLLLFLWYIFNHVRKRDASIDPKVAKATGFAARWSLFLVLVYFVIGMAGFSLFKGKFLSFANEVIAFYYFFATALTYVILYFYKYYAK